MSQAIRVRGQPGLPRQSYLLANGANISIVGTTVVLYLRTFYLDCADAASAVPMILPWFFQCSALCASFCNVSLLSTLVQCFFTRWFGGEKLGRSSTHKLLLALRVSFFDLQTEVL